MSTPVQWIMNVQNEQLHEQQYTVKFCFRQGKSCLETLNNLCTTFGNAMMSRGTVYHWYEAFEKGRASASLKGSLVAPYWEFMEVIVNTAATIIQWEPTLSLKQLTGILNILERSVHTISSTKLNLSHVCAKWVPWLLTNEMKAELLCICKYWRDHLVEDKTWFNDAITMDE